MNFCTQAPRILKLIAWNPFAGVQNRDGGSLPKSGNGGPWQRGRSGGKAREGQGELVGSLSVHGGGRRWACRRQQGAVAGLSSGGTTPATTGRRARVGVLRCEVGIPFLGSVGGEDGRRRGLCGSLAGGGHGGRGGGFSVQ